MCCVRSVMAPSSKCVIRVIITQIEYVQTDVYTRCLHCVFTLRSRLVTQMFTLCEAPSSVGNSVSSGLPRQRKRNLFTLMDSPAKGQVFTLKRLLVTFDVCVAVYVTKCVDIAPISAINLLENKGA